MNSHTPHYKTIIERQAKDVFSGFTSLQADWDEIARRQTELINRLGKVANLTYPAVGKIEAQVNVVWMPTGLHMVKVTVIYAGFFPVTVHTKIEAPA